MSPQPRPPRYKIWMQPRVHAARKRLPGNMRQRIRSAVDELAWEPRPATSIALTLADSVEAAIGVEWEARRIKMDNWRIIYAVNETWHEVAILSVQQRPPYDYGDLDLLLSEL